MKLIVGLGNPGPQYRKTRHNAGFMALEALAQRHGLTDARQKFHAGVLEGVIADTRTMLMQPVTYMNRSGLAVGEAVRFYKLPLEHVMVVVDDTALPLGSIRLRPGGGAGGHNGLADIQRALGSDQYPRLRMGIGEPKINGHRIPQHDYVLGAFSDEEQGDLDRGLKLTADALECWLRNDLDTAMNRFNAKADSDN